MVQHEGERGDLTKLMLNGVIKPLRVGSMLSWGAGTALAFVIFFSFAPAAAQETPPPEPAAADQPTTPEAPATVQPRPAPTSAIPPEERITERFNVPELPPPVALPEADTAGQRLTIIKRDRPVEEIFQQINQETGATVRAMGEVPGQTVSLVARDQTVEEILSSLAAQQDWTWIQRQDGAYEVWDQQSFIDQELRRLVIRRIFTLSYVNAADVQAAVEGVLSEVGQIAVNPRTNELIVTDLPDRVALIESIIEEIDVPLYMRTFYVRYAAFDQLREPLIAIKSEAGTIQFDPINRRIIVTDTLENIREMEQLINLVDVDRPTIAYYLNSIGLEAADAEALIEQFIAPTVSEGALVEFFAPQATLVIQDVPEVHERIIQMLRVLDRAPRMIWIEGEILEVNEDYNFEFGVEVTYDPDLVDAFDEQNIGLPRINTGAGGLRVLDVTGNAQIALDAMMSDSSTVMLLRPRALVRNMQEVDFDLTTENPQITTFFNDTVAGASSIRSSTITFVETGLSLSLVPTISNRGLIEVEIEFENSTPVFVQLNTGIEEGAVQDAVGRNTQRIRTVLIIPSGETRVLGGLTSNSQQRRKSGVPILSQIPWIGGLFGRQGRDEDKRVIYFFLTPTIRQEEPQVELMPVPINPAAQRMAGAIEPIGEPSILFDPAGDAGLPPEVMPYLEAERPGAFTPEDLDGAALQLDGVPRGAGRRLTFEQAEELLTAEPPPAGVRSPAAPLGGPGLVETYGRGGALGPAGVIGRQQGQVFDPPVRGTPVPTPPAEAGPTPVATPVPEPTPPVAEEPLPPSLELGPDAGEFEINGEGETPAPRPPTRQSPIPAPVPETPYR